MEILKIIMTISTFVWLLPPLRQYNTRYFHFFLIVALTDPFEVILSYLLKNSQNPFLYPAIDLLWLAALFQNRKQKLYVAMAALPLLMFIAFIKSDYVITMGISLLILIMMVVVLVNDFWKIVLKSKLLNWFLLALITYSISNVLKTIPFIFKFEFGVIHYNITTVLQLGFGILFCFITIDNSNWKIKRRAEDSSN